MCGLVFLASKGGVDPAYLKAMNDSISHRGPDDEGFLILGNNTDANSEIATLPAVESGVSIGLAHRRLSILDLSELGHQPMSFKSRYWIVYNGEVYNHLELRAELEEKGYSFQSHCDTEVILAAYDFWGPACQNRFNGMWAFTILDLEKREVFISRDRFGIKPLYYYQDEATLAIASEIKALLAHPSVKSGPNIEYCKRFLDVGAQEYLQETAFNNIYRFDFASCATISVESIFKPFTATRFWDYEVDTSDEPFCAQKAQKIADEYYALLQDAVRLRLRADVPFGSTLSGGLDSASIVYLIEQELKGSNSAYKQQTFSTVYSGPYKDCDESYYIKLITDMFGVDSKTVEPSHSDLKALHELVIDHWECPPHGTGTSGINTYNLVRASNVIVTLDGQGADEQQAGYLPYIVNFLYNSRLPAMFREAKKLSALPGAAQFVKTGCALRMARTVLGRTLTAKLVRRFAGARHERFLNPLNEILQQETSRGLVNLIHFSDARSMLFSIEARMPFMDYRLVEFTAKIPAAYKLHDGWTKYFARLAFDKKLPDEVCWRKDKLGWPVPHDQWFNGPLRQWLINQINGSSFIQSCIQKVSVADDLSNITVDQAIRLMNLAVWHKRFFEQ